MGSVSNGLGDTHVPPRTLAGATIVQIVPALRESPVARTAVNVAHALLQSGARALIAADDGPLVAELKAFGGEWVPLINATVKDVPVTVPVRVIAGPQSYATEQNFTYTATEGKKGTAKNS